MFAKTSTTAQATPTLGCDARSGAHWSERICAALASALEQPVVEGAEPTPACLSDDQLLALSEGWLGAAQAEEVDRHLASCALCSALLLEALRARGSEAGSAPRRGTLVVFDAQARVGERYTIVRLLGRGGMGEVYEAFDELLQQSVALKTVLVTRCDSPAAMQRLVGEVRVSRRVNHRNVCRIYDVGLHELAPAGECLQFLTMELIEGETLGEHVRRRGALTPEAAALTLRAALQGLCAIHGAGLVHRDLKSDNLMLRGGQPSAAAAIIDLGLARPAGSAASSSQRCSSRFEGSVSYMAPEQLLDQPVGPPADIFALGVVAFEMLTGELPERRAGCAPSVVQQRAKQALPASLAGFVARCLSYAPGQRYADAQSALEDFELLVG